MSNEAEAGPDLGRDASDRQTEPRDHDLRAMTERRLAQIEEVLGLRHGYFAWSRDRAERGSDVTEAALLSDQTERMREALLKISDPLLRLRLTELLVALADADPD